MATSLYNNTKKNFPFVMTILNKNRFFTNHDSFCYVIVVFVTSIDKYIIVINFVVIVSMYHCYKAIRSKFNLFLYV